MRREFSQRKPDNVNQNNGFIKKTVVEVIMLYLYVVYSVVQRLFVVDKLCVVEGQQVFEFRTRGPNWLSSQFHHTVFVNEMFKEEAVGVFFSAHWNILYGAFYSSYRYVNENCIIIRYMVTVTFNRNCFQWEKVLVSKVF